MTKSKCSSMMIWSKKKSKGWTHSDWIFRWTLRKLSLRSIMSQCWMCFLSLEDWMHQLTAFSVN